MNEENNNKETTEKVSRRKALGVLIGGAAATLAVTSLPALGNQTIEINDLDELDKMATKPKNLTMMPRVTYLGGPTYLIEIGNFRILSDPGFDPQGTERNEGPGHLLTKVMSPPIAPEKIGRIDIALVSHAQHLDNLDNEGRKLLTKAGITITTPESAVMDLPTKSVKGLKTRESTEIKNKSGEKLKITAMPAVHTSNPDLRNTVGEVTGFMLEWDGGIFYISGDTVWIDEINEIAKRYKVTAGILHLGAANVPAVGDNFLTMNASDGVRATQTLGLKNVFPAHFEGWRHFTQGSWFISREFEKAGLTKSLNLLKPGEARNGVI